MLHRVQYRVVCTVYIPILMSVYRKYVYVNKYSKYNIYASMETIMKRTKGDHLGFPPYSCVISLNTPKGPMG